MKHLIITGEQATGKTLLGNYLETLSNVIVYDEAVVEQIPKIVSNERLPYTQPKKYVFITNKLVQYNDTITPEKFLIIRLSPVSQN